MALQPGQILQNRVFPRMQAVIETELLPGFYTWYLAKPDRQGGYVKYGFARHSEIDPLSWEPKQ